MIFDNEISQKYNQKEKHLSPVQYYNWKQQNCLTTYCKMLQAGKTGN